ncbi:AAA family ATPase [Ekhidna sp.]|uniref:AAA family ATPase n=1 Tax=Ekhidna sp. TaxID=2608089 RepID=UPI003C7C01EA
MTKRIAVIGPESTGKSELCQHLARHYDTEWVPEYARFYIDRLDRNYEQHDLKSIAEGQLAWEDEKAEYSNNYLICDTNLIVIKIWSDHKYGETDSWIEEQLQKRRYDFYLLSNIDIPWRSDPQREHPNLRQHFFEVYKNYLEEHKLPYAIVSGIEGERKKCAVNAIENFFSNKEDAGSSPA